MRCQPDPDQLNSEAVPAAVSLVPVAKMSVPASGSKAIAAHRASGNVVRPYGCVLDGAGLMFVHVDPVNSHVVARGVDVAEKPPKRSRSPEAAS
jgi:hypothetical protein